MPQTSFEFTFWHANYTYTKWDVAYGTSEGDTRPTYYYSLVDNNLNTSPLAQFVYAATQAVRTDNVNRIYFTQTGTTYFQPGSPVEIVGIVPDSTVIYSGICLAGGSGYVDYLNPGLSVSNGITSGTVRAPLHPYWTTGFAWIPAWTSNTSTKQQVVTANMGEGYSQRQAPVINSNSLSWSLAFENRTDKEARALLNFLQDKGGVGSYCLPFPIGNLYNNPLLKYINNSPTHTLNSYGLNNVSVEVSQVFDL